MQSLWTTNVCVYEIEFGIRSLPRGKQRNGLQTDFEGALQEDPGNPILDFAAAAHQVASISVKLRQAGRSIDIRDAMIAGIVASRNARLATRNTKHFAATDIPLSNPRGFVIF